MAITVDRLVNDDRFSGDNVLQFLLYLPFGLVLVILRTILGLVLWIASIILPNKSSIRQLLSILACCTFGVYVKVKGTRDPKSSVMLANYVSVLDSLAAAHSLGTISLRKWKVPPFFASALGIRNAAQFVRKQHFADAPSKPVLLQPEGGPTNGRGLLRFTDWPFHIPNRVQPVAICVERPFTKVTVHSPSDSLEAFPWSDALWYLWTPVTVYTLRLLPAIDRHHDDDARYTERLRKAIADDLQVEATPYVWEDMRRGAAEGSAGAAAVAGAGAGAGPGPQASRDLQRLARQVREVLPRVPLRDVLKDLAQTRSVDVTITNFLEGLTPYVAEPVAEPEPTTSAAASQRGNPVALNAFPKNAKQRQMTFQERKAQMIAAARHAYIQKHGLNIAVNNC